MLGPKPIRPLHHYILPGLFVLGLFVVLVVRSPQNNGQELLQGQIMGTYWIVKVQQEHTGLRQTIQKELDQINESMSTYLPQSELSQFNQHQSTDVFPMSKETIYVLKAATEISRHSGGAFDVSIKPIVDLWGFGAQSIEAPPKEDEIARGMDSIGYTKITSTDTHIQKSNPDIEIDLSAIAKGYAVDQIAVLLEQEGYNDYMVDIGGEIRAKGKNAKKNYWRIGIETPDAQRGSYTDVIGLQNMAIATSGDYRNYYEQDGMRISHTIDARTGRPITHNLASVSVLHPSAMMADGWATALNVLGPQEAIKLAEKHNLHTMLIIRTENGEHKIEYSNRFEEYRIINNKDKE